MILGRPLAIMVIVLSTTAACSRSASEQKPAEKPKLQISQLRPDEVIGSLGQPLGKIVVIEGVVIDPKPRAKADDGATLLQVDKVDGQPLAKAAVFHFSPWRSDVADTPATGARFKYRGYETGGFVGIPHGAYEYELMPAATSYHFATHFTILRDEQNPKPLR